MELKHLIQNFFDSEERNLQLDIFRVEDSKVLIQIFKNYDLINWNINFEVKDSKGFAICMFFNKKNPESLKHLKLFKESIYFNNFIFSNSLGIDAYFYLIYQMTNEELYNICTELIKEIYDCNQIQYTLNAY